MTKNAVFLDVDPTIMENKLVLTEESPMERDLNSIFGVNMPKSKLVKPTPGLCVKAYTRPDRTKMFINICILEDIPAPKDISADELMHILDSEEPSSYRVPMSIGEGRTEYDKTGSPVTCYDVAINPNFFKKVTVDNLFQTFFITVVFEGLQDKYQCDIHMEQFVVLRNRKAMGTLQTHRIELRDIKNTEAFMKSPLIQEIPCDETKQVQPNQENLIPNPAKTSDHPKLLFRLTTESLPEGESMVAEFKIPGNVRLDEVRLEVGEDRVVVRSGKSVADFFLPCAVDQDKVVAVLDRNNEMLSVKMPTVH